MRKFNIDRIINEDESPFDRQNRISWWDQEKISKAKVMVVGAGAIGNETLKNMALLGFRNIFIADFDTISTSNLSRTVLFDMEDTGSKKAEVAAQRTQQMCVADDPCIKWFHGDVVWELGTGVFRAMDVVLGCLDNVETRFAINRQCWLAKTPWIDSGIYELAGSVSVYIPGQPPCYQCGATEEQITASRRRYSCDDFKRTMVNEGKVPTVQIASAIASAIQVQEAIKFICGQETSAGKKIYFQGKINDFFVYENTANPSCLAHATYPDIIPLDFGNNITLRQFLETISQEGYSGDKAELDFRGDRTFIVSVSCRFCHRSIELYKPSFEIYESDTICPNCQAEQHNRELVDFEIQVGKVALHTFSLGKTENRVLNMTLHDLGVPYLHVVAVADKEGNYKYYELTGDKDILFSNAF